jgi:hypothetical protein
VSASVEESISAVKSRYPEAHCWIVLVIPELWQVQPRDGYSEKAIGEGSSEWAAWEDAAKKVIE